MLTQPVWLRRFAHFAFISNNTRSSWYLGSEVMSVFGNVKGMGVCETGFMGFPWIFEGQWGFNLNFFVRETGQELLWVDVSCFISLNPHGIVSGEEVEVGFMLGSRWLFCTSYFPWCSSLLLNPCFSQLSFREWLLMELEVCPEKDILSASER